jgi:hypothetical protein
MEKGWYIHDESESILITTEKQAVASFLDYIGPAVRGTLSELMEYIDEGDWWFKGKDLSIFFDNKTWNMMNEKELMIQIMDTFVQISNTKGAGSAAKKRNLVLDMNNVAKAQPGELGGLFEFVLRVSLNSMWVTHINTTKIHDTDDLTETDTTFVSLIGKLMAVRAVNNELRAEVEAYVNSYPKEYREMIGKVITKRVNIGIGVKEVNKALGFVLIPDVEIMKADSDIKTVVKWFANGEDVFGELKYDGIRGFAEMKEGVGLVSIKSYNMSEMDIDMTPHIREQLNKMHEVWMEKVGVPHYFFDFEITGKERRTVSGEVGKLIKGTAKEGCDENWMYNIFDVHPWDVFDGAVSKTPYSKRRHILEGVRNGTQGELPNVVIGERWQVHNFADLQNLFKRMLEEGQEGLVVKCGSGVYEMKRSSNWIKMKAEKDCDLLISGWFAGAEGTKRAASIGGFNCQTADGMLQVSIGSGFKDKDLEEIMANGPDSYIGKIVKVKYNEVIKKKDSDIRSLFLPRFCEIRTDKVEPNTLEYILNR